MHHVCELNSDFRLFSYKHLPLRIWAISSISPFSKQSSNILSHISLIIGTSTGGILAAAMGIEGKSGNDCTKLYRDLIPEIFKPYQPWNLCKSSKYNAVILEEQIKKHFVSDEEFLYKI